VSTFEQRNAHFDRLFATKNLFWLGQNTNHLPMHPRVRQALLTSTNKQVFLRGDGGVQLQDLMDVMDKLKAGGVERVGIVAKLPGER